MKEEPMHQVLEDAPANHSRDCQERDFGRWAWGSSTHSCRAFSEDRRLSVLRRAHLAISMASKATTVQPPYRRHRALDLEAVTCWRALAFSWTLASSPPRYAIDDFAARRTIGQ